MAKFSASASGALVSDERGEIFVSRCIRFVILDKIRRQGNSEYISHDR